MPSAGKLCVGQSGEEGHISPTKPDHYKVIIPSDTDQQSSNWEFMQ